MGSANQLTIATYNVLNLDPNDADGNQDIANGQFAKIASQIVNHLRSPDIIGLQEIQDASGSINNGVTSGALTLQTLVDAIVAAGGPRYQFIDSPVEDNASGGEPGGNIRPRSCTIPSGLGWSPVQSRCSKTWMATMPSLTPATRSKPRLSFAATR